MSALVVSLVEAMAEEELELPGDGETVPRKSPVIVDERWDAACNRGTAYASGERL